MLVTEWYVLDTDTAEWTFNHISKGYSHGIETAELPPPAITSAQQRAWSFQSWWPRKAHLIDGKITRTIAQEQK